MIYPMFAMVVLTAVVLVTLFRARSLRFVKARYRWHILESTRAERNRSRAPKQLAISRIFLKRRCSSTWSVSRP